MMVTPCFTTTLPGSVSSQLPPCSEARSTMTLPGFIDRTQARCGADGGEPGDPRADHEDFRRRYLPGRSDLAGEEAAEVMRGLDDRAVAGDVRHRRQRVELLRARDARHAVHRENRRLL